MLSINKSELKDDIAAAMAYETLQLESALKSTTKKPIGFPQVTVFLYDAGAKEQSMMSKNVYSGYLSSAEIRSTSERLFEQYCETSNRIKWFYRNGDKGLEFFSIVYEDNFGKQKSFYPDYIIEDIDGGIWIIETKGGFSRSGQSEDIDAYTAKKFSDLRRYLKAYNKLGGIVRQDKQSQKLCICTDEYSDDIRSDGWRLLSDVL